MIEHESGGTVGWLAGPPGKPYANLTRLNTRRTVLDSAGAELLEGVVRDYLSLLETSVTVYEANGDFATGNPPHGWCASMDELTREEAARGGDAEALATGKWACRQSCWDASRESIERKRPVDVGCLGGMRIFAVPILVHGAVVGSVNLGHGAPSPARLEALARRFGRPVDELRARAEKLPARSPESVQLAKRALETTARLLGELVERRLDERERELFVGVLGHDLRGPLTGVKLGAEILLRRGELAPAQRSVLARVASSASRMERLISQMLDLTRSRLGGGIPIAKEPIDLALLAHELADEALLERPDAVIDVVGEGDPRLDADADRLRQVVGNLLENALRHGAPDAPITVTVEGADDEVTLSVHNLGDPIPEEVLPSLFDPFDRRKQRSPKRQGLGLGLGLYIARQLVRGHGGELSVRSSAAAGTTFLARLPRHS